jgi:hypothetical protein
MKNRIVIVTLVLLVISIGNYTRIISDRGIRPVEFLSILAIGILTGVLLTQVVRNFFNKE